MQWTDTAIILTTSKHGESSGVVSLISAQHGFFKGLVRGISSKKQCGIYQSGNLVEATWKGRLAEHLGNFTAELITPNAALLLSCPTRLAALSSVCSLLESTLAEREPAPEIFAYLHNLITALKNDDNWQVQYVLLEIELLSHLGFGLDISSCAATGATDNLTYVSPKSGRAICEDAGRPYHDKMLKMPLFLQNSQNQHFNTQELKNGLELCAYFLEKYIFKPNNSRLPVARMRFAEMMG
ncbi:MAG: repair protein RecO [Rickettsiaceae bacterium]|jgi:DNA repair protein RecO (recombination protein O)|nr:repair protein RecO [Rickettsiaceae bacterium]